MNITGKWKDIPGGDAQYNFLSDGTFKYANTYTGNSYGGNYSVSGNTLTLTVPGYAESRLNMQFEGAFLTLRKGSSVTEWKRI